MEALEEYADHARNVERPAPDPDLDNAYRKVRLAKKIVDEGGITSALCNRLLEHVKYWPSWITRGDFEKYVVFDATEIAAHERGQGEERYKTIDVSFVFGQRHYRVVFTDKGPSRGPGDLDYFGEIEFHVDNRLVLAMDTILDGRADLLLRHWEGISVKAFDPGDWMQELLRISAQIVMRREAEYEADRNQRTRETSANIRLPDVDR